MWLDVIPQRLSKFYNFWVDRSTKMAVRYVFVKSLGSGESSWTVLWFGFSRVKRITWKK